jgi:uncharacterized protein (DUF433 family)
MPYEKACINDTRILIDDLAAAWEEGLINLLACT